MVLAGVGTRADGSGLNEGRLEYANWLMPLAHAMAIMFHMWVGDRRKGGACLWVLFALCCALLAPALSLWVNAIRHGATLTRVTNLCRCQAPLRCCTLAIQAHPTAVGVGACFVVWHFAMF